MTSSLRSTFCPTAVNLQLLKALDQIADVELREGIVRLVKIASFQKYEIPESDQPPRSGTSEAAGSQSWA